ncbi:hypothetical protein QTP70_012232 [Hemibagrus guttatus]|uniref:Uncharacterized protein n=1 Tax=Hemibagrus guttatus TaxID=175788 RepID=A0AAE0VAU4_9TELE|nr:hypothetical protein QTP70_012232 [Hemibagrus guttatus]
MQTVHPAFMPGAQPGSIQEYVEAVSFNHFIKHRTLISLEEINACLVFMRDEKTETKVCGRGLWPGACVLTFQVTPTDYLLGVADLTGELMRMCISSVGNGDVDTPFELSNFLRQIHDGFSYIGVLKFVEQHGNGLLPTWMVAHIRYHGFCSDLSVSGGHFILDDGSSAETQSQQN